MSEAAVPRLARLDPGGLEEAAAALRAAGLPADDLGGAVLFRLDDAVGALGWAALERHGAEALLRSVIVAGHRRGVGAGTELVTRVARRAADDGVRRLWLLTETAAPFFARLGFVAAARSDAPAAIRRTAEFARLCPASATCMTRDLTAP